MKNKLTAHGEATVRLTDKAAGRVVREITAHNRLNADYAAEIKNNLFNPTNSLMVFLSDYDQPSPDNGLIFPMGRFLGFGRYNAGSSSAHQGVWFASNSQINKQENGLTVCTFAWEFTAQQAVGTLRSLFLYWDASIARYPALNTPAVAWKGTPRCSFENKLYDTVGKTATDYFVADYITKEAAARKKANTLLVTGLAYDVDTGHIFVFDFDAKKIYEFADIDTDMTAANVLAEYPCTKAHFSRGLIKGGNLFFVTGNASPVNTSNSSYTAATVYLYRYPFKEDGAVELLDTMTCAEAGLSSFGYNLASAYMDDWLLHVYGSQTSGVVSPVIRIVGESARMGVTGNYNSNPVQMAQRISPNKQVLLMGNAGVNINYMPPMAISHLLLPEPVVKDNTLGLSVSYTVSIQE